MYLLHFIIYLFYLYLTFNYIEVSVYLINTNVFKTVHIMTRIVYVYRVCKKHDPIKYS